jgi:hypothetical protein
MIAGGRAKRAEFFHFEQRILKLGDDTLFAWYYGLFWLVILENKEF